MPTDTLEKDICHSMIYDAVIGVNVLKEEFPGQTEYLDNVIDSINAIANRDNPDCIKFGLVQVAVDLTISITGCKVRGCPGPEHEVLRRALEIIWDTRQRVVSSFVDEAESELIKAYGYGNGG
jgi:hypothetical protein